MGSSPLHLFIDADDTLWGNASHFEDAIQSWVNLMMSSGADENEAKNMFRELEQRGFRRGWYGGRRLAINMRAASRKLLPPESANAMADTIDKIASRVSSEGLLVFDGVHDTLAQLEKRHQLYLVTMGEHGEQLAKLEASKLANMFPHIHVLSDKTRGHYDRLLKTHRLERRDTWMIGNSMAKDIRPAKAAGIKTCYLDQGQDFSFGINTDTVVPDLSIQTFPQLLDHF